MNQIRLRAVRREPIDLDKLAQALLRLARDQTEQAGAAAGPAPVTRAGAGHD